MTKLNIEEEYTNAKGIFRIGMTLFEAAESREEKERYFAEALESQRKIEDFFSPDTPPLQSVIKAVRREWTKGDVTIPRNKAGQQYFAGIVRRIMAGSEILQQPKKNVQNAYSLRSVPQVAGACRDALDYIRKITEIEMNAVADNPIFFTKEKVCLTGANFHGAPIGYTQDLLGIVITDLGNISERQTNNLMDPACSKDLPAFLVKSAGLDSGLMISQYTQAALVSENKILASPASVDSIPVSGNQEDHVSFGTIAARKAREIIKNKIGRAHV